MAARPPADQWPPGNGPAARQIRGQDWTATALGPAESWPDRLKSNVETMLEDPQPCVLLVGRDRHVLPNDGALDLFRRDQSDTFGQPVRETSSALRSVPPDLFDRAFAGEAVQTVAMPLLPQSVEGVLFDLILLPLRDADGAVFAVRVTLCSARSRSEARLRSVLDGMDEAVGLMDHEFRILAQNREALRLDGRPIEEIVGRSHWDVYPGSEETAVGQTLKRALAEQRAMSLEHLYVWWDGHARWLDMRAYPVPEGLAVFWRDITDRKLAEERLRESETKYRRLFNSMDEAYAVVEVLQDGTGRWADFLFIEVNPAFMEHTGMPYPVGRTATQILGTPNPRWAEAYGQVIETGQPVRMEEGELTLGRVFDLNIFRLGGPESRRVAVLFTNVTERRKAEAALRTSEEQYRLLFSNLSDGFVLAKMIWDDEGRPVDWRFVEVNKAWEQTGIPVEQVIGRTAREVNPLIEPGWIETCGKVVQTGEPAIYEAYATGFGKWFETVAFRHSPDHFGMLFRDVTYRVRAEENQRDAERRQKFLLRFSDALRAEGNVDAVADRAVALIGDHLQLDRCYIADFWMEEDRATITHQFGRGQVPLMPPEIRLSDFPNATFDRTLVIDDVLATPGLSDKDRDKMTALGFGALIAPTLRKGENHPLWAIVCVTATPRVWSPGEIGLAEEVAERTWAAMKRMGSETALHESEEQYRQLFDTMGEGYAVCDIIRDVQGDVCDLRFVELNQALEKLTGLARASMIGRRLSSVLPEADLSRWLPLYARVIDKGEPASFEQYSELLDRWYEVAVYPRGGEQISVFYRDVTQRRIAEDRLRASESRLAAIFSSASVGLAEVSLDGRFLQVNDELCRILARPQTDIRGVSIADLTHPDDMAATDDAIARAITAGETVSLDKRYVRPDGSLIWANSRIAVLRHGPGQAETLLVVAMDITERRRAEVALMESEERFRAIVERAVDYAIFSTDAEGRIETWPQGARQVFGWTEEEVLGQPIEITFTPEDRAEGAPAAEREMARRHGQAADIRWHQHKTGKRVFIEGMVRPLHGHDGSLTGYLKIGQDVTEKRAVQAALVDSEARFRQFGSASADVLWIRNAEDLSFEYLSPSFETVYGAAVPDVLAGNQIRRWAEMIHRDDRKAALSALRAVRKGKRVVQTFRIQRPDGQIRWLRDTDFPLLDAEGRVQRIGGIAHDVTEELRLQDRLKVMVAELQHRSRNLMGVVQRITDRTLASTSDLSDFRSEFRGRLAALARVNGLLSRLSDGDRITFDQLIRAEITAHGADADPQEYGQVRLHGPDGVALPSGTVQTFALALHELTTNALKYGALSRPDGRLSVTWKLVRSKAGEACLKVEWVEDGIAVETGPSSGLKGFGRELIERALPYQLNAETSYEITPDGVRCTIVLPVSTTVAIAFSEDRGHET